MYSIGKRDIEVVELADIKYEYALLDAHLRLILKVPSMLGSLGELSSVLGCGLLLTSSHRTFARAFVGRPQVGPNGPIRRGHCHREKPRC